MSKSLNNFMWCNGYQGQKVQESVAFMEQFAQFDPSTQRIREDRCTGQWRIEERNKPVEWLRDFFQVISLGILPALFDCIFGRSVGGEAYFDEVVEFDNYNGNAPFASRLFIHAKNIHDFLPADAEDRPSTLAKTCQVLERYKPMLFPRERSYAFTDSEIETWPGADAAKKYDMKYPYKTHYAGGSVRGIGLFCNGLYNPDRIERAHFEALKIGLSAKALVAQAGAPAPRPAFHLDAQVEPEVEVQAPQADAQPEMPLPHFEMLQGEPRIDARPFQIDAQVLPQPLHFVMLQGGLNVDAQPSKAVSQELQLPTYAEAISAGPRAQEPTSATFNTVAGPLSPYAQVIVAPPSYAEAALSGPAAPQKELQGKDEPPSYEAPQE